MEGLKRGDYVCEQASMKHTYKTYYIVADIDEDKVDLIRCTTEIESTHVYTQSADSLVKMNRKNIFMTDFIKKQLDAHKEDIEEEYSFDLVLGINKQTSSLLEGLTNVVTFVTTDKEKLYMSFELELVNKKNPNSKCVTLRLGRMFHKTIAKSKRDWYQDVL